jgi:hypothetical protein
MDLAEVFLDTVWPLPFWVVMVLKPMVDISEESNGGGIAGDVSTNKSSKSLSH